MTRNLLVRVAMNCWRKLVDLPMLKSRRFVVLMEEPVKIKTDLDVKVSLFKN